MDKDKMYESVMKCIEKGSNVEIRKGADGKIQIFEIKKNINNINIKKNTVNASIEQFILKDTYKITCSQMDNLYELDNYKYVYDLQSYDVHPPVYYFMLHTVCSVMPGVFSMWQGIGLNILFSLIIYSLGLKK